MMISFHHVPANVKDDIGLLYVQGDLQKYSFVSIPDTLFWHILDTLNWIPSIDGSFDRVPFIKPAVRCEHLPLARSVFASWASLFRCAPEVVSLRVGFIVSSDPPGEQGYQRAVFDRQQLITWFEDLSTLCLETESDGGVLRCSDFLMG
jgi:hypothetical protein